MIKLAWRNLWRNKRRTLITTASVLFAVFFAILMRSMQLGTYANYINNYVKSYTGYIQVHKKGYWEDKDFNKSMTYNNLLIEKLSKVSNITAIVPRLESFALASYSRQTKGVIVAGIVPVNENKLTGLSKKLIRGKFIEDHDKGLLVAQNLAKFLDITWV